MTNIAQKIKRICDKANESTFNMDRAPLVLGQLVELAKQLPTEPPEFLWLPHPKHQGAFVYADNSGLRLYTITYDITNDAMVIDNQNNTVSPLPEGGSWLPIPKPDNESS